MRPRYNSLTWLLKGVESRCNRCRLVSHHACGFFAESASFTFEVGSTVHGHLEVDSLTPSVKTDLVPRSTWYAFYRRSGSSNGSCSVWTIVCIEFDSVSVRPPVPLPHPQPWLLAEGCRTWRCMEHALLEVERCFCSVSDMRRNCLFSRATVRCTWYI